MGHRIIIHMALAQGAEARLWAIVSQRRIDVSSALFEKNRQDRHIRATLEVETDDAGARRFMRQLERHQDITAIALESVSRKGHGPIAADIRRIRISPKKGAYL
jgi:hypothetical protein